MYGCRGDDAERGPVPLAIQLPRKMGRSGATDGVSSPMYEGVGSSYNELMTTITTSSIPTNSDTGFGLRHRVTAFVAGAVLAGAAATGITAAVAHNGSSQPASTPKVVYVAPTPPVDSCVVDRVGPC